MAEFGVGQASQARLAVLLQLIGRLDRDGRKSMRVLEVGSYEGSSALQWSRGLALLPEGGEVLCIDPWVSHITETELKTSDTYRLIHEDLASGKVFERFQNNIKEAPPNAPISFFRGTLSEWMGVRPGHLFDIVYIDGCHHFTKVMRDLLFAQVLVNDGGILCGDDLEVQISPGSPGEAEARAHAEEDFVRTERIDYHPGVSLAVMETFGLVWASHGTWAVRKTQFGWRSP